MKKIKTIFIWILISLILQTTLLFYLNNYYFKDISTISFKKIAGNKKARFNVNVKVPTDATKISVSHSGRYILYYLDNILHVSSIVDGKDNIIKVDDSTKDVFAKWHDSEDKIVIIERKVTSGSSKIKIYNYYPKDNSKEESLDFNNKSNLYKLPDTNGKVTGLELNTLNTILYVKISTNKYHSYINRLDISAGIEKLPLAVNNIGDYYVFKQEDKILYEDIVEKKVYVSDTNQSKIIKIDGVKQYKLLCVSSDGNIYLGSIENDKITSIYIQSLVDVKNSNEWKHLELNEPVDPQFISVLGTNNIYSIDNLKGVVTNLNTGEKTNYTGAFVQICNAGIMSIFEQQVHITNLK